MLHPLLFDLEMHVRPEVQHRVRAEMQERPEEVLPLQAGVPQRAQEEVRDQAQEKVPTGE